MSADIDRLLKALLREVLLSDPKGEHCPSAILRELVPAILAFADNLEGRLTAQPRR